VSIIRNGTRHKKRQAEQYIRRAVCKRKSLPGKGGEKVSQFWEKKPGKKKKKEKNPGLAGKSITKNRTATQNLKHALCF